ncbi:MAG: hypothetical protein ACPLRU_01990 [Desulfofundulus sp.]
MEIKSMTTVMRQACHLRLPRLQDRKSCTVPARTLDSQLPRRTIQGR